MGLEIVINAVSACVWCSCQFFYMFSDGIIQAPHSSGRCSGRYSMPYMAWLHAGSAGAAARRLEAWEAQQGPVSPSCSFRGGDWPLGVRLCWPNLARWVSWAAEAG